jgi:reactive intermediate/imine deaminase
MPRLETIHCPEAPAALGNYSHAVAWGDLVILSGIASRDARTNRVPGLELDSQGRKLRYDIRAEARAALENIQRILHAAGSALDHVLEVNTYLLDMRDFAAYNEVFAEFFPTHRPARTTIAVAGLPGDISIEMKVVAIRTGR